MGKPVVITPLASQDLENISDWLFSNWHSKVLENFLDLYEAKIVIISNHPDRYPVVHVGSKLRKASLANIISFFTVICLSM
jgi:plasmid stabilization system protein ParE